MTPLFQASGGAWRWARARRMTAAERDAQQATVVEQAACGVMFAAYGTALPGDPPDPHRICLRCGLGLDEHSE
jgi:hypothetical protein